MLRFLSLFLSIFILISCNDGEQPKLYSIFEIDSPELGETKTIWLYLPSDYASSTKTYPVIYFSDGQWLFKTNPNYSQEMHVDEMMRDFEKDGFDGAIVVGIESNEETRHNDFSLYKNEDGLGGNAEAYLRFVTQTLKSKIDGDYRTKPDRSNTCIMGASLGGLACFYALTEHPDIFGKAALFSAALHFNRDSVVKKAQRGEIRSDVRIYGVVGELEFNDFVNFPEDNETLFNTLAKLRGSSEDLFLKIDPDGAHRISYWEREFKGVIEFLF